MRQITNSILMIRPDGIRANEQTAVNNYFQKQIAGPAGEINDLAQREFDEFVTKLLAVGINVIVDLVGATSDTPDAVFPNNWVSFHENGDAVVYPMFAENRRTERRDEVFELLERNKYRISNVIDYTSAEEEGLFLEGTGSLILDRENKKAYCALSPRADEDLVIEFCEDFEYTPVIFNANQTFKGKRLPIYHTNVMMCIAETFAVICISSIDDKKERKQVLQSLKEDGKEIIDITEAQMNQFAGNMLQVIGKNEERFLVMSFSAYNSLRPDQVEKIERHCSVLYSDISTIETLGGGSARCMMAEVFLPSVS
ncbi:MAG: arginine deiminase-related protein [Bacteroidota bacterium]